MEVFHQGMELLVWNYKGPGGVGEVPEEAADLNDIPERLLANLVTTGAYNSRADGRMFYLVRP